MIGGSGLTQVLATGTNAATATSNAGGGGFGLSVSATLPLAKIEGGVTAEFDGTINGGSGLSVIADGTNTATAHAFAVSVGFFAGDRLLVDRGDHGRCERLGTGRLDGARERGRPGRHRDGDRPSDRDG